MFLFNLTDLFRNYLSCHSYGFTIEKLICMGFIRCAIAATDRYEDIVSLDYITDPEAIYHVDIAGRRVKVKVHTTAPQATHNSEDNPRQYRPKVVTSLVS